MLDCLDVADAAGRGSRGSAWGFCLTYVAAAIFVYNLGAHGVGADQAELGGRLVRLHGGGAPSVAAWGGRSRLLSV